MLGRSRNLLNRSRCGLRPAGVSSSSDEVPTTFEQMGANAVAFTRALGLKKADVLGFSIGGMVAQEIALQAPDLVRKLILVGTGPRGGQGMESLTQAAARLFGAAYDPPEHVWLAVQFSPSEAGQGDAISQKNTEQGRGGGCLGAMAGGWRLTVT